MSRVVRGLGRLLRAPGLWLGTWIGVTAIAALVGIRLRLVVGAAVLPFEGLDLHRVVFGTFDVLRDHPSLGTDLVVSVISSAALGLLAWTLLGPLIIGRLAGHRGAAQLGAIAMGTLPAVLVQSLWHLVLRALLLAVVVLSVQALPPLVGQLVLPLVWLACGVALDATRVAVVEHGAARWHVRTAWRGLVRAARRPGLLIPCLVLGLGQLAITAAIVWMALSGYGQGSMWPARLLALLSVGLGLWRIGIVVEDASGDPPPSA